MWSHPVGFFAHEKRDWSHAGRNHAPFSRRGVIKSRGMRRQPSPTDRAGKTKLIEPLGIVIDNPTTQDLPLPGIGGNLKSLQLAQHLERGAFPLNLRSRCDVLPAQKPAHELRRGDRLNLLAQRGHGQPVNARQQAPLAPFQLVRSGVARAPSPARQCR